jgi:CheY-like chemotaxis protein
MPALAEQRRGGDVSASGTAVATAHKVLLVEDSPDIRAMVAEWLRDEGYEILEASDGGSAIRALRSHRPPEDLCLVVLDMMLPVADGLAVLRALADLGGYVPVVAMSADHDQLARARAAGATATLRKPFDLDRLLAVVRHNCEG